MLLSLTEAQMEQIYADDPRTAVHRKITQVIDVSQLRL